MSIALGAVRLGHDWDLGPERAPSAHRFPGTHGVASLGAVEGGTGRSASVETEASSHECGAQHAHPWGAHQGKGFGAASRGGPKLVGIGRQYYFRSFNGVLARR